MRKIVNLHVHDQFSILDGLGSCEQYLKKVKESGVNSLAITNHGNNNGWGQFYQKAKQLDMKPIFGTEFYYINSLNKWTNLYNEIQRLEDPLEKKEKTPLLRTRKHLIVLAKNITGFQNLNKLLYESQLAENFYYTPRIDWELLLKYKEGLIVSSACISGPFQTLFLKGNLDQAEQEILKFKDAFGKDFYLEIQILDIFKEGENIQRDSNNFLIEMGKKHNIRVVVTSDAHYVNQEDYESHQTMLLLQTKKTRADLKRGDALSFGTNNVYLHNFEDFVMSAKELNPEITEKMLEEFADNTFELDSKIEKIEFDMSLKIKDVIPEIQDKDQELRRLCEEALKEKGLTQEYTDRLNFELNIIKEKKFAPYFHLVKKTVDNARNKMLIGVGRGSAAGSLINYLLGITEIDPIKYNLLFSRFLSINRSDPPDIDIDFENNDVIKQDILNEYGLSAANISTYSCFNFAGLLKDLTRCYEIETPSIITKLNNEIQTELEINTGSSYQGGATELGQGGEQQHFDTRNWEDLTRYSPKFVEFVSKYPDIERDMIQLLGKVRHTGTHAAGVIIHDNLIEKQPLMLVKGIQQTSLTEGVREKILGEFGYVKMDILGLNTLRIFHTCLEMIKPEQTFQESYNELLHPDKINLEDEKVYQHVFKNGNLAGVFQFNTSSIRSMIEQTKPDCFEDLSAINALFRPGPLASGFAYEYGKRKCGEKSCYYYKSDLVKEVLEPTMGIIIYQEQVMQLAEKLADYTPADSNDLRKTLMKTKMTDKEILEMKKELTERFVKKAVEKGMTKRITKPGKGKDRLTGKEIDIEIILEHGTADDLLDDMIAFAGYGFNRAHSISYAMIAYQCAWLKTYYPLEFYCALLKNEEMDNYGIIISEIKKAGYKVNGLNLNNIARSFNILDGQIYFGFENIKGIGEKAAQELIRVFDVQPYTNVFDFLIRTDVNWRVITKRTVEALINLGAFDKEFPEECREKLINTYHAFFDWKNRPAKKYQKEIQDTDWLERIKREFEVAEGSRTSPEDLVKLEMEAYKTNLQYSPFEIYGRLNLLNRALATNSVTDDLNQFAPNYIVQFKNIYIHIDKNRKEMAFLRLQDRYGTSIEGVIFASYYKKDQVKEDGIYIVRGKKEDKFIINWYRNIDEMEGGVARKMGGTSE